MKLKWLIEDFVIGFKLERLEFNSTFISSVKYGLKSVKREIRSWRK